MKICQILKLGSLLIYKVYGEKVKAKESKRRIKRNERTLSSEEKISDLGKLHSTTNIFNDIYLLLILCSSTKGYKHIVTSRREM